MNPLNELRFTARQFSDSLPVLVCPPKEKRKPPVLGNRLAVLPSPLVTGDHFIPSELLPQIVHFAVRDHDSFPSMFAALKCLVALQGVCKSLLAATRVIAQHEDFGQFRGAAVEWDRALLSMLHPMTANREALLRERWGRPPRPSRPVLGWTPEPPPDLMSAETLPFGELPARISRLRIDVFNSHGVHLRRWLGSARQLRLLHIGDLKEDSAGLLAGLVPQLEVLHIDKAALPFDFICQALRGCTSLMSLTLPVQHTDFEKLAELIDACPALSALSLRLVLSPGKPLQPDHFSHVAHAIGRKRGLHQFRIRAANAMQVTVLRQPETISILAGAYLQNPDLFDFAIRAKDQPPLYVPDMVEAMMANRCYGRKLTAKTTDDHHAC